MFIHKKIFLWFFIMAALFLLPFSSSSQDECPGCRRGAEGGEFKNHIFEIYASPCFFLSGGDIVEKYREKGRKEGWGESIKPRNYSVTEYLFESSLETHLGGKDTFMEHGKEKKVESSLTISLFYDGDERILVKTWQAKSPVNSIESLYNRMFENQDAEMRKNQPIEELLWEFEQTPLSCEVTPEKDTVSENEQIQILLSNFQGQNGPSKSFNRILVQADHGEILNGTPSSLYEKTRVFKVGQGSLSVEYKSPNSCEFKKDKVHVYSSCDIAKEAFIPLSETKTKDEISKKDIKIECEGEWAGTITLEQTTNLSCQDEIQTGPGNKKELNLQTTQTWKTSLHVRAIDITVAKEGVDVKRGSDMETSGTLNWSLEQERKEWMHSPGSLTYIHETRKGNHTGRVGAHSLSLTFTNAALHSASSSSSLLDEIQLSQEEEAIELKIIIMCDFLETAKENYAYHKKTTAEGRKDVTVDRNSTLDHQVTLPAFLNVRAVYIKGKDGSDQIIGSSSYHSQTSSGELYDCPPVKTTQKWTLDLKRNPKKEPKK